VSAQAEVLLYWRREADRSADPADRDLCLGYARWWAAVLIAGDYML
jgi:hypothetical protein